MFYKKICHSIILCRVVECVPADIQTVSRMTDFRFPYINLSLIYHPSVSAACAQGSIRKSAECLRRWAE